MKSKVTLVAGLTICMLALSAGFMTPEAKADNHLDFGISVYHGINGKSLGLSKDLPVIATVNGSTDLPVLKFKDRYSNYLPEGEYTITVRLADGTPLPSMTVGPVFIPAGVNVSLHARLSGGKTPILDAKIR